MTGAYCGFIGRDDALRLSRAAALDALRLDEGLADGHVALGDIRLFLEWDWDGARDAYAHALKVQPHHDAAVMGRARLDCKAGRFDEAIATWNDLRAHDPASTAVAWGLVAAYVDVRRFSSALEVLGALDSRGLLAHHRSRATVAGARVGSGDCHAALREVDRAMTLLDTGDDEVTLVVAAWIYATCGRPHLARSLVARLDSPARSVKPDLISLAAVYGALGDTPLAIDLLERGVAERSPVAVVIDVDFMLDPLRAHPAFERLAARVRGSRDTRET